MCDYKWQYQKLTGSVKYKLHPDFDSGCNLIWNITDSIKPNTGHKNFTAKVMCPINILRKGKDAK